MLIVIQRVKSASLDANSVLYSQINLGLLAFVGICSGDNEGDIQKAVDKISNIRIFNDNEDKMNLSLLDIGGEVLLVPNFTLCADTSHGRRPDFTGAEKPAKAKILFESLFESLKKIVPTKSGVFGANMRIEAENDGPITIIVDTKANSR